MEKEREREIFLIMKSGKYSSVQETKKIRFIMKIYMIIVKIRFY